MSSHDIQWNVDFVVFRIQYAKADRWKPPIDLASEMFPNHSFHATSFGPCCPQIKSGAYFNESNEQCLYLNIYRPILPSNHSLVPVLFWIHGGAHNHGCSTQSIPLIFNGTNIINHAPSDQPVVVVTINYRLGPFADMFLRELIDENPQWPTAGNYMYLDMLSALRWVKKNIGDYGGDANNVTIFGQSAGGLSVTDLGAVRDSEGLFKATISQSGLGSPGTYSSYYNMSQALDYSNTVVRRLNCTNEDKQKLLSCMRNISIDKLLVAYNPHYTRPIIDNYFFPLYPPLAIQNGKYNNVTLIMGHNDYEKTTCMDEPDMNYKQALASLAALVGHEWAPIAADFYHLTNCSADRTSNTTRCCDIMRLITLDKMFDCDIRRIFNAFYSKYGPEYARNKLFSYHLNCYPECPIVQPFRVCRHSSELPFVFGTVGDCDSDKLFNCTWDNSTRVFSNGIIANWVNTATNGRPLLDWPSYDPTTPKYYHMTPDQGFIGEIWHRNCSFFDMIETEGIRQTFFSFE